MHTSDHSHRTLKVKAKSDELFHHSCIFPPFSIYELIKIARQWDFQLSMCEKHVSLVPLSLTYMSTSIL